MPPRKVVIIPVYKNKLSGNEVNSITQCLKILHNTPICFICANNFDFSNYNQFMQSGSKYYIERFKNKYFTSVLSYNKLLLSIAFYRRFKNYDYLLIYQLDAWVFKNELNYWCEKGYSYIGAPWYEGWGMADETSRFVAVGNGGFSLRDIKAHINVLEKYKYKALPQHYYNSFKRRPSFKTLKKLIIYLLTHKIPNTNYYWCNEDVFFGRIAPKLFKNFLVPDVSTALQFAVEVNPELHVLEDRLPFGCHAWEKFQPEFWKKFIKIEA